MRFDDPRDPVTPRRSPPTRRRSVHIDVKSGPSHPASKRPPSLLASVGDARAAWSSSSCNSLTPRTLPAVARGDPRVKTRSRRAGSPVGLSPEGDSLGACRCHRGGRCNRPSRTWGQHQDVGWRSGIRSSGPNTHIHVGWASARWAFAVSPPAMGRADWRGPRTRPVWGDLRRRRLSNEHGRDRDGWCRKGSRLKLAVFNNGYPRHGSASGSSSFHGGRYSSTPIPESPITSSWPRPMAFPGWRVKQASEVTDAPAARRMPRPGAGAGRAGDRAGGQCLPDDRAGWLLVRARSRRQPV